MSSVMAESFRLNLEEWDQIGDVFICVNTGIFICVNTGLFQGWEGIGRLYQSNEYSHLLLQLMETTAIIDNGLPMLQYVVVEEREKFAAFKESNIVRCEFVFVVHRDYFFNVDGIMDSYHRGMSGVFAIENTRDGVEDQLLRRMFHPFSRLELKKRVPHSLHTRAEAQNPLVPNHYEINFNLQQFIFLRRLQMRKEIELKLKATNGRGGFEFNLSVNVEFIEYCVVSLKKASNDKVLFRYVDSSSSMECTISDVSWLFPMIGDEWYLHLLEAADLSLGMNAFVPQLNSPTNIKFDCERLQLTVSVGFVSRELRSDIVEQQFDFAAMSQIWKAYEGWVVYNIRDETYSWINTVDNVGVAWLFECDPSVQPQLNAAYLECRENESVRRTHCVPHHIQDVLDMDMFYPMTNLGKSIRVQMISCFIAAFIFLRCCFVSAFPLLGFMFVYALMPVFANLRTEEVRGHLSMEESFVPRRSERLSTLSRA